jgi:hypothetical protein
MQVAFCPLTRGAGITAVCLAATMTLAPDSAFAQSEPGSVYLNVGVMFPLQEGASGPTNLHYVPAVPGGSTRAWTAGGGMFFAPQGSLEVEISRTGTMRAQERFRGGPTTTRIDVHFLGAATCVSIFQHVMCKCRRSWVSRSSSTWDGHNASAVIELQRVPDCVDLCRVT